MVLKRGFDFEIDNIYTQTGLVRRALGGLWWECACAWVCVKKEVIFVNKTKTSHEKWKLVKTVKITMQKSFISLCKSIISTEIRQSCHFSAFPLIVGSAAVNVQTKSKNFVRMSSSWGYGKDNGNFFLLKKYFSNR